MNKGEKIGGVRVGELRVMEIKSNDNNVLFFRDKKDGVDDNEENRGHNICLKQKDEYRAEKKQQKKNNIIQTNKQTKNKQCKC